MWALLRDPSFWRSKFLGVVLLGTTGTVDGTALPFAIVRLCPGGPQTEANGAGAFVLRNIPIGTYTIVSYNRESTQRAQTSISVTTGGTTTVVFSYSAAPNQANCGCP